MVYLLLDEEFLYQDGKNGEMMFFYEIEEGNDSWLWVM